MCRITQLALLRHLTNSKIMGADVCSQARAWQVNDAFAVDPRVIFFDEPAALETNFRSFTQSAESGHALWTDAYLAAFAIGCGFELASLDADFQRFTGLTVDGL
jgi:predicted nucleic acid-binding protein